MQMLCNFLYALLDITRFTLKLVYSAFIGKYAVLLFEQALICSIQNFYTSLQQ